MPIKSYLVHPHQGMKDTLIDALSKHNQCEVIPAKNKEIIILITDTENSREEDLLKEKIESISSLKLLAMVSGFNTPKN
ncbi:hypothetical protein [uncultured Aquimarina sp.]|uniref:hypothetical protein n=1 Tax=uncultured Aquimarina sp. TaxID=575652 RepID=UPI00262AAE6D|nr:hypothetical protein [uncultured Aquimarina sp.]